MEVWKCVLISSLYCRCVCKWGKCLDYLVTITEFDVTVERLKYVLSVLDPTPVMFLIFNII